MNLKEAFRFQNKLKELSEQTVHHLSPIRVTRVETTYLRKKTLPEAEDVVEVCEAQIPWDWQTDQLVDFMVFLLDQRAAMGRAIRTAKAGMELDMDLETALNSQRQSMASTLRIIASFWPHYETVTLDGGTAYRFNAKGEQVPYRCDVKTVTTIDCDRDKVRKLAAKLHQQTDAASTALDVALVTTQVDYQPPFDVNDSYVCIFEQFCEEHGQS